MCEVSEQRIEYRDMLLASAVDSLRWLVWSKTKDAEHNRNRPESILQKLMGEDKPKDKMQGFESIEAFEEARKKIIGG